MKNTNKILNTLNNEAKAAEAKEAAAKAKEEAAAEKAELEAAAKEVNEREDAYKDQEKATTYSTIKDIKDLRLFPIVIKTTDYPDGYRVRNSGAFTKEEVERTIEYLRLCAPNGLRTSSDVMAACSKLGVLVENAMPWVEADKIPDANLIVDGTEYLVVNGSEVRDIHSGELIITIPGLAGLSEEQVKILVAPAVREAVAKKDDCLSAEEDYEEDEEDEEGDDLPSNTVILLKDLNSKWYCKADLPEEWEVRDAINDYLEEHYDGVIEDFCFDINCDSVDVYDIEWCD